MRSSMPPSASQTHERTDIGVRVGRSPRHYRHHDVQIPEQLATLLSTLTRGRRPTSASAPRPPTRGCSRPAARPRPHLTGRATALASVLAKLLDLHSTTAVRWIRDADGDWNRYAAQLAHARSQP